jgi:mxaJ protein
MSSASDIVRGALRDCATIAAVSVAILALAHVAVPAKTSGPGAPHHLDVRTNDPAPTAPDPGVLRVCADPNNLPFSNARLEGFENAIADLVARDLRKRVDYYWQPQRRGFIRTTLAAGWCDLVIGVPSGYERVRTTDSYYRSTYVFVSRRDGPAIRSLDDPRLRRLRIGVEMTGEDAENPPALEALAARHLVDNLHGYLVYGDYSTPNPTRGAIDAVANGEVDTAIAWGPRAGYFGSRERVPLRIDPVTPDRAEPGVPFTFAIAMGVRRGDRALCDALNGVLARRRQAIDAILRRYGVPLLPLGARS